MKYIGAFIIIIASVLLSGEYSRYIKKRAEQCEEWLSFIGYMRVQISCFLRPSREIAIGFSGVELEKIGFLKAVNDGESLYGAYKATEKSLALTLEEREIVETLFFSIEECYLDVGIKIIDSAYEEMEKACLRIREERPKNVKLAATLSVTASIGFLILIL